MPSEVQEACDHCSCYGDEDLTWGGTYNCCYCYAPGDDEEE